MLKRIVDGVWVVDREVRLPGGVRFPTRCTFVRLGSGDLWVHSPVEPSDSWIRPLKELGPVAHIVAPNAFHHLFIKRFWEAFPEAKAYAPPALQQKRSDIPWSQSLRPDLWPDDFDSMEIKGIDKIGELVFLHKGTKTVIVTDIMFHFLTFPHWKTRLVTWLANAAPGPRISRLLKFVTTDKAEFVRSLRRLAGWEFERMIMAHGEIIESGARASLSAAITHRYGPGDPPPEGSEVS